MGWTRWRVPGEFGEGFRFYENLDVGKVSELIGLLVAERRLNDDERWVIG